MKTVYFLRHGVTELNASWRHQYLGTPLSTKGKKQAQSIAKRLKDVPIDTIIASPLARAKETARIVSETIGVPIEESELFVELRRPRELWGTHWLSPKSLYIMGLLYLRAGRSNYHYSDEENLQEFHARAREALQFLTTRPEQHILVVTHRGFMANLFERIKRDGLDTIAQYKKALWKNLAIGNCCFFEAHWTPKGEYGETLDGTWSLDIQPNCPLEE